LGFAKDAYVSRPRRARYAQVTVTHAHVNSELTNIRMLKAANGHAIVTMTATAVSEMTGD
jgi:hypothetical protein